MDSLFSANVRAELKNERERENLPKHVRDTTTPQTQNMNQTSRTFLLRPAAPPVLTDLLSNKTTQTIILEYLSNNAGILFHILPFFLQF